MNKEVSDYIRKSDENHVEILRRLRELIMSSDPSVKEQYKWSRPVYALDKDFCYLKTTKKHVIIGFFEFDKVVTNKQLIEGTGKSMRHIKLSSFEEIDAFHIKKMLEEVLL